MMQTQFGICKQVRILLSFSLLRNLTLRTSCICVILLTLLHCYQVAAESWP